MGKTVFQRSDQFKTLFKVEYDVHVIVVNSITEQSLCSKLTRAGLLLDTYRKFHLDKWNKFGEMSNEKFFYFNLFLIFDHFKRRVYVMLVRQMMSYNDVIMKYVLTPIHNSNLTLFIPCRLCRCTSLSNNDT